MAEHRRGTKGRRMGSSRRRQLREGSGEAPTAAPGEEPLWASETVQTVQDFFREQDKDQAGFVTRSDMKKLQEENFPCSAEELELVFDGLDAAGTGRLRTEEFSAGLCQFLSSQKAARDHRWRKTTSRRVHLVFPSTMVEGADSEEQRHFAAFMEQLGTDHISEEKEIWQLWVKLRQEEPQLLGNLEDFLAKMRHRIQETRSKKEALEVTLNKCIAEHDKEVQQLCGALEQQIRQEKQRLEQESMARSHQHGVELQRALDASEREVQRLVTVQMELETRCRSLRGVQQATSTENRQLEENNRELENRLQHLHQQLQQTRGHLQTARAAVAWEHMGELRDRAVAELPEEAPVSPQMSPTKSEKYRSEMRIRLGSQGGEPKAKSTHQVVWEMPLAVSSRLGAVPRASSTEDDPFPEFLKEERFSDQSTLLREMNDAITALSKQLKTEAPGAALVPADAAPHRRSDDDEPQTGLGAATAFGPTPGVLQKVLLGHITPELKEGPARAQLGAPDMPRADAWRLGSSGQAAHSELQEQVSAKADKEEGAGNDQLRMVLGDSSLGDAANSSTQPQRQLLGGETKDLSAGQQEKKQEVGQKMSQEGKASPGAATADRAGPAPRGSPEASPEPDHLYNVLFVGDSHVGKTSFLYRLHADTFNPHLTATVGLDYQVKNLIVDNKRFALRLWDSAGQERYHSITKQFFRKADGVVLMYDITSEYSFSDVRYWLSCIQEGAEDGVAILLLGNKTDCAAERRVPTKEGERLAKEHQLLFYECSAASGHNVSESIVSLIRMLKVHEDELKKKAEEVPKPPQKKKGCC
ncbi:ras-related protein Rab-44 isoform X4 [Cuculus canorus]|uniref:ras-related protein Rab-44 isoform X4 n=1 Tax=Cuculus canorus TaxID=55661 RepID=UPI0023AB3749|nr:ras-related protein Rab-44 isoform X4 [Cuculus canorus]